MYLTFNNKIKLNVGDVQIKIKKLFWFNKLGVFDEFSALKKG